VDSQLDSDRPKIIKDCHVNWSEVVAKGWPGAGSNSRPSESSSNPNIHHEIARFRLPWSWQSRSPPVVARHAVAARVNRRLSVRLIQSLPPQREVCGSVVDVPETATVDQKLPPVAPPHAATVLPQISRTVTSGTWLRRLGRSRRGASPHRSACSPMLPDFATAPLRLHRALVRHVYVLSSVKISTSNVGASSQRGRNCATLRQPQCKYAR
jgi:hypothetical protein